MATYYLLLPSEYSATLSVGGRHNGNHTRSDSRRMHNNTSKSDQFAFGTKDWSRKSGMGVPGSMDLSARTGLHPICDLVPAGSEPTARSDPPSAGGEDPAGCDQTATSPSSKNGDGAMPSPSIRPDGNPNCCLLSGDASGGGVSSAGADGAIGAAETIILRYLPTRPLQKLNIPFFLSSSTPTPHSCTLHFTLLLDFDMCGMLYTTMKSPPDLLSNVLSPASSIRIYFDWSSLFSNLGFR